MLRPTTVSRFIFRARRVHAAPINGYEVATLPDESVWLEYARHCANCLLVTVIHGGPLVMPPHGFVECARKSAEGPATRLKSGILGRPQPQELLPDDPHARALVAGFNLVNLGHPDEVRIALLPHAHAPRLVAAHSIITTPTVLLHLDTAHVATVTGMRYSEVSTRALFALRNAGREVFASKESKDIAASSTRRILHLGAGPFPVFGFDPRDPSLELCFGSESSPPAAAARRRFIAMKLATARDARRRAFSDRLFEEYSTATERKLGALEAHWTLGDYESDGRGRPHYVPAIGPCALSQRVPAAATMILSDTGLSLATSAAAALTAGRALGDGSAAQNSSTNLVVDSRPRRLSVNHGGIQYCTSGANDLAERGSAVKPGAPAGPTHPPQHKPLHRVILFAAQYVMPSVIPMDQGLQALEQASTTALPQPLIQRPSHSAPGGSRTLSTPKSASRTSRGGGTPGVVVKSPFPAQRRRGADPPLCPENNVERRLLEEERNKGSGALQSSDKASAKGSLRLDQSFNAQRPPSSAIRPLLLQSYTDTEALIQRGAGSSFAGCNRFTAITTTLGAIGGRSRSIVFSEENGSVVNNIDNKEHQLFPSAILSKIMTNTNSSNNAKISAEYSRTDSLFSFQSLMQNNKGITDSVLGYVMTMPIPRVIHPKALHPASLRALISHFLRNQGSLAGPLFPKGLTFDADTIDTGTIGPSLTDFVMPVGGDSGTQALQMLFSNAVGLTTCDASARKGKIRPSGSTSPSSLALPDSSGDAALSTFLFGYNFNHTHRSLTPGAPPAGVTAPPLCAPMPYHFPANGVVARALLAHPIGDWAVGWVRLPSAPVRARLRHIPQGLRAALTEEHRARRAACGGRPKTTNNAAPFGDDQTYNSRQSLLNGLVFHPSYREEGIKRRGRDGRTTGSSIKNKLKGVLSSDTFSETATQTEADADAGCDSSESEKDEDSVLLRRLFDNGCMIGTRSCYYYDGMDDELLNRVRNNTFEGLGGCEAKNRTYIDRLMTRDCFLELYKDIYKGNMKGENEQDYFYHDDNGQDGSSWRAELRARSKRLRAAATNRGFINGDKPWWDVRYDGTVAAPLGGHIQPIETDDEEERNVSAAIAELVNCPEFLSDVGAPAGPDGVPLDMIDASGQAPLEDARANFVGFYRRKDDLNRDVIEGGVIIGEEGGLFVGNNLYLVKRGNNDHYQEVANPPSQVSVDPDQERQPRAGGVSKNLLLQPDAWDSFIGRHPVQTRRLEKYYLYPRNILGYGIGLSYRLMPEIERLAACQGVMSSLPYSPLHPPQSLPLPAVAGPATALPTASATGAATTLLGPAYFSRSHYLYAGSRLYERRRRMYQSFNKDDQSLDYHLIPVASGAAGREAFPAKRVLEPVSTTFFQSAADQLQLPHSRAGYVVSQKTPLAGTPLAHTMEVLRGIVVDEGGIRYPTRGARSPRSLAELEEHIKSLNSLINGGDSNSADSNNQSDAKNNDSAKASVKQLPLPPSIDAIPGCFITFNAPLENSAAMCEGYEGANKFSSSLFSSQTLMRESSIELPVLTLLLYQYADWWPLLEQYGGLVALEEDLRESLRQDGSPQAVSLLATVSSAVQHARLSLLSAVVLGVHLGPDGDDVYWLAYRRQLAAWLLRVLGGTSASFYKEGMATSEDGSVIVIPMQDTKFTAIQLKFSVYLQYNNNKFIAFNSNGRCNYSCAGYPAKGKDGEGATQTPSGTLLEYTDMSRRPSIKHTTAPIAEGSTALIFDRTPLTKSRVLGLGDAESALPDQPKELHDRLLAEEAALMEHVAEELLISLNTGADQAQADGVTQQALRALAPIYESHAAARRGTDYPPLDVAVLQLRYEYALLDLLFADILTHVTIR